MRCSSHCHCSPKRPGFWLSLFCPYLRRLNGWVHCGTEKGTGRSLSNKMTNSASLPALRSRDGRARGAETPLAIRSVSNLVASEVLTKYDKVCTNLVR
jgi:hypothetical protein